MLSVRNRFIKHLRTFCSPASKYTVRTHTCNELGIQHKDQKVCVMGWLRYKRMNRFLVIRDSYGSIQAVVPDKLRELVSDLPYESVIRIDGRVTDRGSNRNENMRTGDVEIEIENLVVLNKASTSMPMLPDENCTEKTRLKYRYIDLRSDKMQRALRIRSEFVHNLRKFLVEQRCFVDVETPTLFRRTPGGATEFVVPAPIPNQGLAYSLPQSPQQFKQLLMVGGIDRYFQIARCYRDEGSKGDRQPEFTQVDLEMSFTNQEGVMKLVEEMIISAWPQHLEHLRPASPFPRISYKDAMRLYGIDKPDMRIPWVIEEVEGDIFDSLLRDDECVRVIKCTNSADTNISNSLRNEWKRLIEMNENGQKFAICHPKHNKWFRNIQKERIIEKFELTDNDVLVVCWGSWDGVYWTLGQLRNYLAENCGLRSSKQLTAHWVVDFPLFSIENGEIVSTHHPFTAPVEEHEEILRNAEKLKLAGVTGQHYDLVINGVEMGGGSIRIHNSDLQRHVLKILDEPMEEMKHLLDALSYGAPPHGGFALGLDRFIALLTSEGDPSTPVRDVIAFPKTKNGKDLMSDSPASLSDKQLKRYGISLKY